MRRARLRGREEAGAPLLGQPLQDGIERRLEAHVEKPAGVATRVGVALTLALALTLTLLTLTLALTLRPGR